MNDMTPTSNHRFTTTLDRGRRAALICPEDISSEDCEHVWQLCELAFKGLRRHIQNRDAQWLCGGEGI